MVRRSTLSGITVSLLRPTNLIVVIRGIIPDVLPVLLNLVFVTSNIIIHAVSFFSFYLLMPEQRMALAVALSVVTAVVFLGGLGGLLFHR